MSNSRLEKFIYAICSMEVSDLPAPLSRIEILWNCLITGETPDFEPQSRNEQYLMAMLGLYELDQLPTPMSRGEKLLYKIAVGETDLSDVPGYLSRYEELLKYLIENGGISGGDFEYVLYTLNQSLSTLYQTVEKPVKSAILKGSTKYRDIDTGEILDTFEDGRNLELVSVKMPVLSTTGKNLIDNPMIIEQGVAYELTNPIYVKKGDKLTFIVKGLSTNIQDYQMFVFGDTTDISLFNSITHTGYASRFLEGKLQTITLPATKDGEIKYFKYANSGYPATANIEKIMLCLGEGESYEPYKSNILTVNEDVTLRGIGNVQDTLDCLTGEVTERIGEIVLDGSEDEKWTLRTTLDNVIYFRLSKKFDNFNSNVNHWRGNTKCNKFISMGWVDSFYLQLDKEFLSNDGANYPVISIGKEKLTSITVDGFKQWLSQNPITIQYQVATESIKTVDLTTVDQDGQPTKLKTFNDISHVEINADNIIPSVDIEVATKISETLSTLGLDHHELSETQNKLGQTIDEQTENTDATMMATTEIYENL